MRPVTTIMSIGTCVIAMLAATACDSSTSPPAPDKPSGQQSTQQWPMPNLTGATLQDAQDQIQDLTAGAVYFTDSHDLSGEDRAQVDDSNWKVCTQNVEPDGQLTPDSQLDFGVVKLDESCP